jgi:hypothetical protein
MEPTVGSVIVSDTGLGGNAGGEDEDAARGFGGEWNGFRGMVEVLKVN